MFLTIANRTSTAIDSLQVDGLKSQAIVTFKNGNSYAYGNVSKRAILNVMFNPDVSLGFWVNNNLVQSDRAYVLNGDEFDYKKYTKRARLEEILSNPDYPNNDKKINLPSFV
tara:strand:+ start:140 stop:475 length:336 start_codon:yes stop_codon:yes gene_type:complete